MFQRIVKEKYGSSGKVNDYIIEETGVRRQIFNENTFQSFKTLFQSIFMPQGYPESVSGDYLEYQIWDTIQAFCSSITATLATQSILKGVGVGDSSATIAAATLTWLLKDGTSMVGRIMFAWFRGSVLDCDCKRWRFFADILNDVAIFLDIIAQHFIHIFTLIVCISGILKSVVGVAGGSTRSAIMEHQARRNNMADLSAKDGSQETLVNLAGLMFSILIIPSVSQNTNIVWLLFLLLTGMHLYANYRAVRCIVMETLNQTRLRYIVFIYLQENRIASLFEANRAEPILTGRRDHFQLMLGCSIGNIILDDKSTLSSILANVKEIKNPYICSLNFIKGNIYLALSTKSCWMDQLKASYHAHVIQFCYAQSCNAKLSVFSSKKIDSIIRACVSRNVNDVLSHSQEYVEESFSEFVCLMKSKGWVTSPVMLGADEWRFDSWN